MAAILINCLHGFKIPSSFVHARSLANVWSGGYVEKVLYVKVGWGRVLPLPACVIVMISKR